MTSSISLRLLSVAATVSLLACGPTPPITAAHDLELLDTVVALRSRALDVVGAWGERASSAADRALARDVGARHANALERLADLRTTQFHDADDATNLALPGVDAVLSTADRLEGDLDVDAALGSLVAIEAGLVGFVDEAAADRDDPALGAEADDLRADAQTARLQLSVLVERGPPDATLQ